MTNFDTIYLGNLTAELTSILRHETVILKEMRIIDIKPLLERKQEIALEMEKQREMLHSAPELVLEITAEEKQYLSTIAADYDDAMTKYQKELLKAQRVNKAIISKITEYVREHVQSSRGYNKRGTRNLCNAELTKNTPAIKFNEQI